MYQSIYIDRKRNVACVWDDEQGLLQIPLDKANYAYRKKPGGKYKSLHGDELERIYKFSPKDPTLFESDVSLDTKILIDLYENDDNPSKGHRILYFDIEVSSIGGFPKVDEADKEITAIALYDAAANQYTAFILDKERRIEDYKLDNVEVKSLQDEDSLLMHFLTKWEEIQPTIVSGWNSDGFDTPYIHNRIKNVLGNSQLKRLSPIGVVYKNDYSGKIVVAGVNFIDYMNLYKKYNIKMESSYALGYVGKKVVGIEKVSYQGSLDDLFKKDIRKYIEYNLNDVRIIVALEKKLQFIEQARAICHKGHVPYDCFLMPSRFLEGAILMFLRRNGLVSKNKPVEDKEEFNHIISGDDDDEEDEKFEGAYVKTPIPGRYDWIFDLDMEAMYPKIMISLNISPETKLGVVSGIEYDDVYGDERVKTLTDDYENLSDAAKTDTTLEEYVEERILKFNSTMFVKKQINKYHMGSVTYTDDEFRAFITNGNLSISGNGVLFRQDKIGIIPQILTKWFDERAALRKLAKKHGDAKEWEMYDFYDRQQKVVKVLLNSVYGCLGLCIWRFHDKDNASAVTITGQELIKTTAKAINDYFRKVTKNKDKDYVIYSDTDSVGPETNIRTESGILKIKNLFSNLEIEESDVIEDLTGRKFIFPKNLNLPFFDDISKSVKLGKVKYIEKHRVKKVAFKVKTKNGKEIEVTEDHSIMVLENGKLVEKKPSELKKCDKIISIKNVEEVWEDDRIRLEHIKRIPYIKDVRIVWEDDFRKNPKSVINECIEFLKK